ncbi:MAG: NADH-quinone oxidoreductase subunit A [Candidatus Nephrothrix sp. EaCA]|nr:MAG: NADH-quinone oxidoreductase subunit A [Candidatus Nephrothrix sp. EaCA]
MSIYLLIYIVGGLSFLLMALGVSKRLRPNNPNPRKLATYESGEETQGSSWAPASVRFYILAIIFLLFEIDVVFLFPWASVYADTGANAATLGQWGWWTFFEMLVFLFFLVLGLIYVWHNGYLDVLKPTPETNSYRSSIPKNMYDKINEKYEKGTG